MQDESEEIQNDKRNEKRWLRDWEDIPKRLYYCMKMYLFAQHIYKVPCENY